MNWGMREAMRAGTGFALLAGVAARFAISRGAPAERHTASALADLRDLRMKGTGPRPFPAAIAAIVRPDATERSFASSASRSLSCSVPSRCLMRSQLFRPPLLLAHAHQNPTTFELLSASTNLRSPFPSCVSALAVPSGAQ